MIELYIDGKKADLTTVISVAMNYELEKLQNPTIIKNNFSKTIQLQATPTNNKIFSTKKKCKNNSYPKRGVKNSHEFFTPLLILVNVALKLVVLIVIGLFVFALIVLVILIVFVVFLIFCFFHLKHLRLYCVTQTKKNSFLC